jgi:hypothetical protein
MDTTYTPGDTVPSSGIYEVIHGLDENKKPHEVIALQGEVFPTCQTCQRQVKFKLVKAAKLIKQDDSF